MINKPVPSCVVNCAQDVNVSLLLASQACWVKYTFTAIWFYSSVSKTFFLVKGGCCLGMG